ncbi:MAG: M16 family metallopeptidase [Sandaracinaceae bacterium]
MRAGITRTLLASLALAGAAPAAALTAQPRRPPSPSAQLGSPLGPEWGERQPPSLVRRVLPNGLQVMLEPLPHVGRVAVAVAYRVGHRDQPEGYRGLAHLTEHLMFAGSPNTGEQGFFRYAEAAGATEYNAFTENDETLYYCVVPAHQLPTLLWLESDRMAYLLGYLEPAHVAAEQQVVLREYYDRVVADPFGRARPVAWRHLFGPGHPYRDPFERREDLLAVRLDDVRTFFQRHYAPDRATLAIVGAFELAPTLALVERYFGPIRRSGPPVEADWRDPGAVRPARVVYRTPRQRDHLDLLWRTPRWGEAADGDLDLIAHALAGTRASRLAERLEDRGLARTPAARQSREELASVFRIGVSPGDGVSMLALETEVFRVLEGLVAAPPSGDELVRAQEEFLRRHDATAADLGWRARLLSIAGRMSGRAPDEHPLAYDLRRYGGATPRALAATAARWLDPADAVIVHVRYDPRAPEEGRVAVEAR